MKTALCLHGLVGNVKGKSGDKDVINMGSNIVLDLAYLHWEKYILSLNNVDVFIHSWNRDLRKIIVKKFAPKSCRFEGQIIFDIPEVVHDKYIDKDWIEGSEKRAGAIQRIQNHYSKWYSFEQSVRLATRYASKNGFKYDCIFGSRFDTAVKKEVLFDQYDMSHFWKIGGPPWDNSRKTQDHCFFSNHDNMLEFSKLYNKIPIYVKNYKMSSVTISNHRLAKIHMHEVMGDLDLKSNEKIKNAFYETEKDNPNKTECPIIRQLYFNYTRHGPGTFNEPVAGRLVDIKDFCKNYNS